MAKIHRTIEESQHLEDGTTIIPVFNTGMFATIDSEDFSYLSGYSLTFHKVRQRIRLRARLPDNSLVEIYLAQFLLKRPQGYVEYIDGNFLNNRKSNLRVVTRQQSARKMKLQKNSTSGVKGVYWRKQKNRWEVTIKYGDKITHLGSFKTLEEARAARLAAEEKYFVFQLADIPVRGIEDLSATPTKEPEIWRLSRTIDDSIHRDDGTTLIPLTQGMWAVIDTKDFDLVKYYTWSASKGTHTYYASTNTYYTSSTMERTSISLHRLLLGDPDGLVDHKDRNGLNNCRSNLRISSRIENARNSTVTWASSGFRGVSWQSNRNYWEAHITVNGTKHHLGVFQDKQDAVRARKEAEATIDPEFYVLEEDTEEDGR